MIIEIAGKSAHSRFGLAKIQAKVPEVTYAEHVHILELTEALDDVERAKVEQLLDYGPDQDLPVRCGEPGITVVPRTGRS